MYAKLNGLHQNLSHGVFRGYLANEVVCDGWVKFPSLLIRFPSLNYNNIVGVWLSASHATV